MNTTDLQKIDAYWRASNYLAAGQLYLLDNPLLRRPLTRDDVKKKIVGHWGTVPGQNFVYVHLNRVIKKYDQDLILISGPGHGGNFFVANAYLDGTYSEVYPNISRDEEGMKRLFKQFSFPGGISSHVAPETPGSINEGGELGYSIAHAFGAVFDNPDLICAVTVGDGEAETGPLATSWQSNKFLNPVGDGAVLPILHLNGYKISNPTVFGRMTHEEMEHFFLGCSWKPYFVEGDDPMTMHTKMAETLDTVIEEIHDIQRRARAGEELGHIQWPMIVLRTPKGWTGPKVVDGKPIEGTFRAHQVPIDWAPPTRGNTCARSRHGCAATTPRNCSTRTAACCPNCRNWPPPATAASPLTPTPTAASCCGTCAPPISRTTPWTCPPPAAWKSRT